MSVTAIKTLFTQKPLDESVNFMAFQSSQFGATQAAKPAPAHLSKAHLSSLWIQLTGIYGTLFTSKHGISDTGVWFAALKDLTPKALESGLERLMTLKKGDKFCEFPPNCLQFRALCLGFYSDLRMPSAAEAHREVLNCAYKKNPKWSHAVVQFTANRLGFKFLAIENEGDSFAIFKEAYEQVCHLIRQGHQLQVIAGPVLSSPPQSKEVATTQLAKIRQLLGVAK